MNDERHDRDWREATLTLALEEHFGRTAPDVVSALRARIGDGAVPPPAVPPRAALPAVRRGRPLAAAALMLLGIGAVVAVAVTRDERAPAQDAKQPLLPLVPGTEWTSAVTRAGSTRDVVRRVLGSVAVPGVGERQLAVHQVLVRDRGASGFEYWSADERGLLRHANVRGGLPVVEFQPLESGGPWTRVVALPLGTEASWPTTVVETRDVDRVAAAGGAAAGGRSERVSLEKRGEVVAPTVEVTVPAGTFRAVHVRLSPAADGTGDTAVEQLWLAPGVGVVRATREQDGATMEVTELRSFTPGRPVPEPEQVLRTFLAKDAGVTNFGPVQSTAWLPASGELLLPSSRFAVVRFVDRTVVYRVHDGVVVEFDPAATDAWTTLVREEGLTGWRTGLLPQHRCVGLADLALRLLALHQGLAHGVFDSRFSSISIDLGGAKCVRGLVARAPDGAERRLQLTLTIGHDDEVKRIELRE
jgi:hypothetical protein